MSVLNDDGVALNLSTVLILFLTPNLVLILLTAIFIFFASVSKKHPKLIFFFGTLANFFSRGALVRIIANIFKQLEEEKNRDQMQTTTSLSNPLRQPSSSRPTTGQSSSSLTKLIFEKKHDADYLLLIPIQIDLLLTVLVYKILTRDVYFETCRTYLTTYHNRPQQVVCWLKFTNSNVSNLSINSTLHDYCVNQTPTYINYEHNDVICSQYVFKLINIIDATTNVLAWHQAIVLIVTKSVVFAYWWQRKLHKTLFWYRLVQWQRHMILNIIIYPIIIFYVLIFVFIFPSYFGMMQHRRIDLTHNLFYAGCKFVVATVAHINIYTLSKWYAFYRRNDPLSTQHEKREIEHNSHRQSPACLDVTEHLSASNSMTFNDDYSDL